MKQILIKIVILFFFATLLSCMIYIIFKDKKNVESSYLKESNYYFRGTVVSDYTLSVNFFRALVIQVDSISLVQLSSNGYAAAYNQEKNEIIFYTAILVEPDNSRTSTPTYICVDSRFNSIRYNDDYMGYSGNYKSIRALGLYRKHFEEVLASRGGEWIRF